SLCRGRTCRGGPLSRYNEIGRNLPRRLCDRCVLGWRGLPLMWVVPKPRRRVPCTKIWAWFTSPVGSPHIKTISAPVLLLPIKIYLVVRELAEKIDIALSCLFVHIYPHALDSKRVMRIPQTARDFLFTAAVRQIGK